MGWRIFNNRTVDVSGDEVGQMVDVKISEELERILEITTRLSFRMFTIEDKKGTVRDHKEEVK